MLQVRACRFPIAESQRGKFDLVLVTDHLNTCNARVQILQALIALLDKDTVSATFTTLRKCPL